MCWRVWLPEVEDYSQDLIPHEAFNEENGFPHILLVFLPSLPFFFFIKNK